MVRKITILLLTVSFVLSCGKESEPPVEFFETVEIEHDIFEEGADIPAQWEVLDNDKTEGLTETEVMDEKLTILSVLPAQGKAKGGETVIIKGSGLDKDAVVIFDQSKAIFSAVMDANTISCITPPHSPGVVDIRVISAGETAILEKAFTYYNELSIESVKPHEIHVGGGVPITITGKGFDSKTKFFLGEKEVMLVTIIGDSEAFGIAPANSHGFKKALAAKSSDSYESAVLSKAVFYYYEPFVEKIDPPAGPVSGGMEVKVLGQGFYEGMALLFGGKGATVIKPIDTYTLTAKIPPNPEGLTDVKVETKYGKFLLEKGFYYFNPQLPPQSPKIHSIKPSHGPTSGGTQIYITASGLTSKGDTKILICGKEASIVDFNKEGFYLSALTPSNDEGFCDVTLKNSAGVTTVNKGFKYLAPLALYALTPSEGDTSGGTPVAVHGAGFTEETEIYIGTLPLSEKVFKSAQLITGKTPPGTPGKVDIYAIRGMDKAVLKNGFLYLSKPFLNMIYPDQGSITGGTLVKLFGSAFGGEIEVYFGEKKASHITLVSDTVITAQSPPNDIGTVDVRLVMDGEVFLLPQAFTYYDPESLLGGTWGGEIEGTLNVTVNDAGTGAPVSEAYVILWTDSNTPYQGFTNSLGQITFTGDDLSGWQMVSASKECYENTSVIKFNAKNITVFMQYTCPSPGMPPFVAPGTVRGRVIGLDKYVQVPPGNCWFKGVGSDGISCKPCYQKADCGEVAECIQIGEAGKFCSKPCTTQADCLEGYMCIKSTEDLVSCVPAAGKKGVYCETTAPYIFAENPEPGPGKKADKNGNYSITTRLGVLAVVCLGGIDDPDTGIFTPYVMGVKRHLFVPPGGVLENQNVYLNIPLNRTFKVKLLDPPSAPTGPHFNYLFIFLDFGAEGVFQTKEEVFGFETGYLEIKAQPAKFTGEIYDVGFTLIAGAFSSTADNTPFSVVIYPNMMNLDDDLLIRVHNGKVMKENTGLNRNINGMFYLGNGEFFAAGEDGIYYFDGVSFTKQSSPKAKAEMRALFGADKNEIWAVGDMGQIWLFNGAAWSDFSSSAQNNLRAISGVSKDNIVAVGNYRVIRYNGSKWEELYGAPLNDYYDVFAIDEENIILVGAHGTIIRYNGVSFLPQASNVTETIYGVWGDSPLNIWAVGSAGTVLRYNGAFWEPLNSGTSRALWDVVGLEEGRVLVIGDGGTILLYENNSFKVLSDKNVMTDLRAILYDDSSGQFIIGGISAVVMQPFLQVPEILYPQDNGLLKELNIKFKTKPGFPASFNYMIIAIPSIFGDVPVWTMITDGDVKEVNLPDFENIEGTPGIPSGTALKLTVIRAYREGFDINNFDYTDLNTLNWRAWAVDIVNFTR